LYWLYGHLRYHLNTYVTGFPFVGRVGYQKCRLGQYLTDSAVTIDIKSVEFLELLYQITQCVLC
jgi:hypothetical protein